MAEKGSPAANNPATDGRTDSPVRGITWPLIISGLVFALGALAVAGVAVFLDEFTEDDDKAEILILPILLIYGVVTLIVAIAVLASILSYFDPDQRRATTALGLPEGSVPAVIALILVLIFAITSVFLASLQSNATTAISEDFATQILTTTGTLAVAVAGFYFGSRAVEQGATVVAGQTGAKTLQITSPSSPAKLGTTKGTKLSILLKVTPPESNVVPTLTGDASGEVVQLRPGEFEYRRGDQPAAEVTIHFELAGDPTVSADLRVEPELPEVQQARPPEGG